MTPLVTGDLVEWIDPNEQSALEANRPYQVALAFTDKLAIQEMVLRDMEGNYVIGADFKPIWFSFTNQFRKITPPHPQWGTRP